MKIGILTIYGGKGNYGNILQNYGLQYYLKQQNVETVTLRYEVSTSSVALYKGVINRIYSKIFSAGISESFARSLRYCHKMIYKGALEKLEQKRQENFERFEKRYIATSQEKYANVEELKKIGSKYSCFIVGSDQVWNPYGHGAFDEYFLSFVDKEKRIAYAPSIGLYSLNDEQKKRYKELLNGFDTISCRESTGKRIIEDLTGKHCEHVVDPVLLAGDECWNSFVEENNRGSYILTYFLGEPTTKVRKYVADLSQKYNLNVIDIYDPKSEKSLFASVEDFVNLIAHAEVFITDSFHGCAFSIMLETQFLVTDRHFASNLEKMNSRIDDMLDKVGIGNRYIGAVGIDEEIDFSTAKQKLALWRDASSAFLLKQIEEKK